MRLTIILVDAELELAPGPSTDERMPVLDAFYHRDLMQSLPRGSRRGRGDIVHSTLLMCQDSELNRDGRLRVFVHTRDDKVIGIERGTKVHPNYVRFLQDMGALLTGGPVTGYSISSMSLASLVQSVRTDLRVAMSPSGKDIPLGGIFREVGHGEALVMIGAFPEGDYASPVYELADLKISLGSRLMRVPEVTAMVLQAVPEEE